jgi:hypothetical protein
VCIAFVPGKKVVRRQGLHSDVGAAEGGLPHFCDEHVRLRGGMLEGRGGMLEGRGRVDDSLLGGIGYVLYIRSTDPPLRGACLGACGDAGSHGREWAV